MSARVYMSSHVNFCCDGPSHGRVIPVKFLHVSVNTLPAEHETSNALVGLGLRNGAHRASQNVTVHRLSAYSQKLLFTAHLHDSRLYQAKGAKTCCAHRPCIDRPILCCLLSQYTHNPSWSILGFTLRTHIMNLSMFFCSRFPFSRELNEFGVKELPEWEERTSARFE